MSFYKHVVSPALDMFDSEFMHSVVRDSLHLAECSPATLKLVELMSCGGRRFIDHRLKTSLAGLTLENPLLVAAGWDKNCVSAEALSRMGFAGVEIGSVLERPQPGNPKPRQFIVAPGVALNRLGFNSLGMEVAAKNLERYRSRSSSRDLIIGVNIGKNKEVEERDAPRAYAAVARCLYSYASYFVVNVSSPNTPGLRKLQDRGVLTEIVKAVLEAFHQAAAREKHKPLFIKIAPELTPDAVNDVIEVVTSNGLSGIIATNTVADSNIKARYGEKWRNEAGGLSGDDDEYRKLGNALIAHIYRETSGKVEIIGSGGVKDAATALQKIKAGAKAVQIMTALRGEGAGVATAINRGIAQFMDREGVKSLAELVGTEVR